MIPHMALSSRPSLLRSPREAVCIALVATLLPLFFVPLPWSFSWLPGIYDFGHIIFFALITLLIHGRYPLHTLRRGLAMTAFALVLGIVIELIQSQIGRTASVTDVLRNLLGTWSVIFWQQSHRPAIRLGRFVVSLLILAELLLVTLAGVQRYQSLKRFPTLNAMEAATDLRQWRRLNSHLSRSELAGAEGTHALQVALSPGDFSGAILGSFPADWSAYTHFHIDLYNAQDETLSVALRIHDRQHEQGVSAWLYEDRFNRSFELTPGWNHLNIPLLDVANAPTNRLIDLKQIRELRIFIADSKKPKVIYVDNLRLALL